MICLRKPVLSFGLLAACFIAPAHAEKADQDKPIILHCKSGVRSAECLAILKGAGFADATHVSGGVIAWAKQIDTSLPVY